MYVGMYLCMCISMYLSMHVHACMYLYMYLCMYLSIYTHTHLSMYICMCECMYLCIYVSISDSIGLCRSQPLKFSIGDFPASHLINKILSSCSSQHPALDKNLRTLNEIKHSRSIFLWDSFAWPEKQSWEEAVCFSWCVGMLTIHRI